MEKILYVGKITTPSHIEISQTSLGYFEHEKEENFKILLDKKYHKLLPTIKKYIMQNGTKNFYVESEDMINECDELLEYINPSIEYRWSIEPPIIYEQFEGEDGQFYGREIETGLIFPLITLKSLNQEYSILFKRRNFNREYIAKLCSRNIKYINNSMAKCGIVIVSSHVADINELEEYKKRRRKEKKEHQKKLLELHNENVFLRKPKEKEKKETVREKSDEFTIIMENIEFLLRKLRKIDESLANKYEDEYNQLLESENQKISLIPLNKGTLISLEAKIELLLTLKKRNSSDISQFLESLKETYLDEFTNGNKEQTKLTIEELDKITELFLKTKDSYTIQERRNIQKNIAFIYLMEVYENKDNIEHLDLNNSYFQDNLKSIIIYIEILMELGIIQKNMIIDLEQELTTEYVLELIKNIIFVKQEPKNIKKLIKEIR